MRAKALTSPGEHFGVRQQFLKICKRIQPSRSKEDAVGNLYKTDSVQRTVLSTGTDLSGTDTRLVYSRREITSHPVIHLKR